LFNTPKIKKPSSTEGFLLLLNTKIVHQIYLQIFFVFLGEISKEKFYFMVDFNRVGSSGKAEGPNNISGKPAAIPEAISKRAINPSAQVFTPTTPAAMMARIANNSTPGIPVNDLNGFTSRLNARLNLVERTSGGDPVLARAIEDALSGNYK
jgi:hypothetical protein